APPIVVAGDRLVSRGGRRTVPIDPDEARMPIDETDDTPGPWIGVLFAGMPGATEKCRELPGQNGPGGISNRPELFSGDAWEVGGADLVTAKRVACVSMP